MKSPKYVSFGLFIYHVLQLFGIVPRVLGPVRAVVGGRHGQLVAAVVLDRLGVALDPYEADAVAVVRAQEAHPEVGVLLPGKPLLHPREEPPLRHGVDHILRVGVDGDLRTFVFQRLEGRADGHELHAVVGRQAEAAGEFLAVGAREEHGAVTARARVPQGRAVGVDGDCGRCCGHGPIHCCGVRRASADRRRPGRRPVWVCAACGPISVLRAAP